MLRLFAVGLVTALWAGLSGCNRDGGGESRSEAPAPPTIHARPSDATPVATPSAPVESPAEQPVIEVPAPAAEPAAQPLSGGLVPPDRWLDELNEMGTKVMLEGKYEVPVISAGRIPGPTRLTESPGYRPPDDPESDAVLRGHRHAEPNPARLSGGAGSAESLAREILLAVALNERQPLLDLRVNFEEFSQILWPEMPQSRPITNISAEDSWFFLSRSCVSAVDGILAVWGGKRLEFAGLSFKEGLTRYPNYRLYQGVVIHALLPDREEVRFEYAHTFAEKDGVWKVYIYKD